MKKYQWMARAAGDPRGNCQKGWYKGRDKAGRKERDPVFVITDLLPHLGREQNEQKVKDFINAEKMDLLIGSRPSST